MTLGSRPSRSVKFTRGFLHFVKARSRLAATTLYAKKEELQMAI